MHLQPNCWNEYDQLNTVIVCSPSTLDVPDSQTAKDVQWEKPVDQKKAHKNFKNMVSALEREGVRVINYSDHIKAEELSFQEQLINRIFVRDLACTFGNIVLPGEAGTTMRRPEYVTSHLIFSEWFHSDTFKIEANNELKALEYGDVFIINKDAVFINTGIRTSIESIEVIKDYIFRAGFSEIGLIDLPRRPDTLHLDMNCNVCGTDIVIAKSFMRYFPVQVLTEKGSKYEMMQGFLNRHGYDVEWVVDVKHTVADINFLNVNPETILISSKANKKIFTNHPKLKKKKFVTVDVDELEKGGGGIRCMTLPLNRS